MQESNLLLGRTIARAITVTLIFASSSLASIIATTGAAILVVRPPDARDNVLTSATQVFAWNEVQDYTLTAPLLVDAVDPGTYLHKDLITSAIPAGTQIQSHYLSFQSPGQPGTGTGSVTVDQPILGIMARNDPDPHLDDSDYLGLGTLFSEGEQFRGLDGGEPIAISADRRTFTFTLNANSPGDDFRIITAIPEPVGMFLIATTLLIFRRRRP